MQPRQSTVLCISGFDPGGGAGLQADIETVTAIGLRSVCAQTCNTLQDSNGVKAVIPAPAKFLSRQIEHLRSEFDIAAVKVGFTASRENVEAIARSLVNIDCPLVVDPVLQDGTGKSLYDAPTRQSIREHLSAISTCTTPNLEELMALAPEAATAADAAGALLREGCKAVFTSSEAKQQGKLRHALYLPNAPSQFFSSARLSAEFHGSGCTLASALAAYLALENPLGQAVASALAFTARALEEATTPERSGRRRFPQRSCHLPG